MKLKILGCPITHLSLDDCMKIFDKFPRVKVNDYSVLESGVLDSAILNEKLDKKKDRKGRSITTYNIDSNLGWILFYYVSKTDYDTLSYDLRDSLYSIDIESQRPRVTKQKSRILVIGYKPSVGRLCILSPRGEIFPEDTDLLKKWFQDYFWNSLDTLIDLQLQDGDLIDIAKDCLQKKFRVDGAGLTIEDLSIFVHCREKSLVNHHLVKSTEDSLQIENMIKNGEWNNIAIEIYSGEYSYIIYFSKSREIWDHVTINPSRSFDRMSIFRAAPFFDSVLSLISMSLHPRLQEEEQSSLSDFY